MESEGRSGRVQAGHVVLRISALAQRAEYIWADGLEGSDHKVTAVAMQSRLAAHAAWRHCLAPLHACLPKSLRHSAAAP